MIKIQTLFPTERCETENILEIYFMFTKNLDIPPEPVLKIMNMGMIK